jgi:hypothetical protein
MQSLLRGVIIAGYFLGIEPPFIVVQAFELHCKKRLAVFPVPSRDFTYQSLPGRE